MDVDAYVAAHRPDWHRLEQLLGRNRLTGAEADELVHLYSRAATSLSVIRSTTADPALLSWLSSLVARGRASVTGSFTPAYRDVARFFQVTFPAALYRTWRWWAAVGVLSSAVVAVVAYWVAGSADVQAAIAPPDQIKQLVEQDFASYYSDHPAQAFAAQVWTNNVWVAAQCIAMGVLVLPTVFVLFQNAANVGVAAGLMAANGRLDVFFGLITPHGLLELTAVFVAAGVGLRVGWAWIAPGSRTRLGALAEEGRAAISVAMGLVVVLLVSGIIEAFVTPSGLPTWARIGIGVLAEAAFLGYVVVFGRRATRAGYTGDVTDGQAGDVLPTAA